MCPLTVREVVTPGTDLRAHALVTGTVDVSMLPKAIGGDAVSFDEDGKEDERCSRGFDQPSMSKFLAGLE